MAIVNEHEFSSVDFTLIGAGTGGKKQTTVLQLMLEQIETSASIRIVQFRKL